MAQENKEHDDLIQRNILSVIAQRIDYQVSYNWASMSPYKRDIRTYGRHTMCAIAMDIYVPLINYELDAPT